MNAEKLKHGKYLGAPEMTTRKRSATLSQDISLLDLTNNFIPGNPTKRDYRWSEIRTKRILLKEHLERIAGVIESEIIKNRNEKEVDEEIVMVGEMLCYGRLLNVGENSKVIQMTAISIHIKDKGNSNWNLIKGNPSSVL